MYQSRVQKEKWIAWLKKKNRALQYCKYNVLLLYR